MKEVVIMIIYAIFMSAICYFIINFIFKGLIKFFFKSFKIYMIATTISIVSIGAASYFQNSSMGLPAFCVLIYCVIKFLFRGNLTSSSKKIKTREIKKFPSKKIKTNIEDGCDDYFDDDDYERQHMAGRRPNEWCCEWLLEYELGYYNNGANHKCSLLNSSFTSDEARRTCYYSESFHKCPVWQKQIGVSWNGKCAGRGKSPNEYCCKFLKDYSSGDYEYYSHRCEATEIEMSENEAKKRCYYRDDYTKCPIYQRNS